jgi:hypothetical protein
MIGPVYQAISKEGLAAGVMEGAGIGLLDSTAISAMPVGSHFGQTQLQLTTGPVAGGTATAWLQANIGVPAASLGSIYFGLNAATSINNSGYFGTLDAVTPAGQPGPVDVRTFSTDGGSQLIPWGFTYGRGCWRTSLGTPPPTVAGLRVCLVLASDRSSDLPETPINSRQTISRSTSVANLPR